jgi:predicted peptidase
MGGYGSLYLGQRHADRFAAIVAICPTVGDGSRYPFLTGSSYEEAISGSAEALSKMPIWLFHGEQDPVFVASISSDLSRALQELGADVRYTEYSETGHNAWDPAYQDTDMITLLFQQRNAYHAPTDSPALHH